MAQFEERRDEAEKRLRVAEHLLSVTHSLVEDPKLLLTISEHLYASLDNSMNALLEFEKRRKAIPAVPESFEPRAELVEKLADKHGVEEVHINTWQDMRKTLGLHEDAQVEFPRGEKFVIADEEYDLDTLTPERVKEGIETAKELLKRVDEVVTENERVVGRSTG